MARITRMLLGVAVLCLAGQSSAWAWWENRPPKVKAECVIAPEPSCTFTNLDSRPASGCIKVVVNLEFTSREVCSGKLGGGDTRQVKLEFPGVDIVAECEKAGFRGCNPVIKTTDLSLEGVRKWLYWIRIASFVVVAIGAVVGGLYWQRRTRRLIRNRPG